MRRLLVLIIALIAILALISAIQKYLPQLRFASQNPVLTQPTKVVTEESVTISDVKQVGPSVVTIEEKASSQDQGQSQDFGPFSMFGLQQNNAQQDQPQ